MASINKKPNSPQLTTHEGGKAVHINAEQQLRRSLLNCMLWENNFYENGEDIATRIASLTKNVSHDVIAKLAIEARNDFKLRHAPLMLLVGALQNGFGGKLAATTIANTISRPDEMSEILSLYWKDGKKPLSNSLRKGLAEAFSKFNEYQLGKWDKNSAAISLRDVMFLTHPHPQSEEQTILFKKIADNLLETPDTWETNLSAGKDKTETFTRLLNEKKLGGLALLRNLRNMVEAGVDSSLIKESIRNMKTDMILPFRFTAAQNFAPVQLYDVLEQKFLEATTSAIPEKLKGETLILVDISVSMSSPVSDKSDLTALKAAATVAAFCREICEDVRIFKFNDGVEEVRPMHGFSLINAFQCDGGTRLGNAVAEMNKIKHDRLIVITDEQSSDRVPNPIAQKAYMINVASYQNGVGYKNNWNHIDGWSERILNYIYEVEKTQQLAV